MAIRVAIFQQVTKHFMAIPLCVVFSLKGDRFLQVGLITRVLFFGLLRVIDLQFLQTISIHCHKER